MSCAARASLSLLVAFLVLAGCSNEPSRPEIAASLPDNQTPQNTALRLMATYEQKRASEYRDLFTGDFTYEFSNFTDPVLVARWSGGWSAADELASAHHLFQGGFNLDGQIQPAATSIDIALSPTLPVSDPIRDSTTHKVLFAGVAGQIVIPPTSPSTDPVTFVFAGNRNSLYLVRGDSAQGLSSSQPADSNHWYIWRWVDETTTYITSPSPRTTEGITWGRVKGIYR